jgi:hypothetical protein
MRVNHLPAALLGLAVLGLAAPALAATPATGHIVVSSSGLHRTYACGSGDTVAVHGNSDKLMFTGTCSTLTVSGKADFLTMNRLSKSVTFTSTSKSDYACWDSGSPAIHNNGLDNVAANCHARALR